MNYYVRFIRTLHNDMLYIKYLMEIIYSGRLFKVLLLSELRINKLQL